MTTSCENDKKDSQEPTISLCMIVKDEQDLLGQCLESVKNVVDEMVIVDTGSSDDTIKIAKSYGAKIFHYAWDGSFSKARNYGLQFASCDWILQLDADEALEKEDIHLLKRFIRSKEYVAVFVALLNDTDDGFSKHYFQRIFRKGEAHYEGVVHNQLKYEGADVITEIRVYHYGYNLSKAKMDAKYRRTESLLLQQLSEDENNPFTYQNYIRILRAQKRFHDGVAAGRKAMVVCQERMNQNNQQMVAFDTANCLLGIRNAKEAEMLCHKVLRDFPKNIDILFTLAGSLKEQKKFDEAIEVYHRFLNTNNKKLKLNPHLIYDTYSFHHKAWAILSDCYFEIGDLNKALSAIGKAIRLRPDISIYKVSLARLYIESNRRNEAINLLNEDHEQNRPGVRFYMQWIKFCQKYPETGNPIEVIKKGLQRHPKSDRLHNQLAYATQSWDVSLAEKEWNETLSINPDHIGAHVGLARIYSQREDTEKFEKHIRVILQKCDKKGLLKEMGELCLKFRLYSTAVDLCSKYLTMEPGDIQILVNIAECYAQMGQFEASLLGYKEALRLNPRNPMVLGKMRGLQRLMEQASSVSV